MNLIVQEIDLNIICSVFLFIVTLYISAQLDFKKSKNKYAIATAYFVIFQLIITAIIKLSKIEITLFSHDFIYYLYVCVFLNTVAIITSLSMFVLRYEEETLKQIKYIDHIIKIPVLIVSVMLIVNALYNNFFIVDECNLLIATKYFDILYFTIVINVFILFITLIINRKKFLKIDYNIVLTLEGNMLFAIIIDIVAPNLDIIWPIVAFNLTVILIGLRSRMVAFDNLTHAYIRETFEKEVENKIAKSNKDKLFSLMFIDLDEFKSINDTFGHSEGDYVLRKFVKLLYEALGPKVKVVRYGGDEFVVYLDIIDAKELNQNVAQIAKVVNDYNEKSGKKYNIKYSLSSGIYTNKYPSFAKFLRKLDNEMYKRKKAKKERYDRITYIK